MSDWAVSNSKKVWKKLLTNSSDDDIITKLLKQKLSKTAKISWNKLLTNNNEWDIIKKLLTQVATIASKKLL